MSRASLARAAWLLVAYTVLVILWGAFVRATGAGAGCGNHWPLCNGEVVPRSPGVETIIEFGHRLTSGLLGLFVVGFAWAAWRAFPRGHVVRKGALGSVSFVAAEALIGAGLVRFEWVASNDSQERVYVMAFHLVNTFLLLAVMTLTAWFVEHQNTVSLRRDPNTTLLLALAFAGVMAVGASGAVTALGDTLLLTAGIAPEDSPVVAKLVGARFYHPTLALGVFAVLLYVLYSVTGRVGERVRGYAFVIAGIYGGQLALGAVNVLLKAPVWMQLVHLAISDALWILLVVFGLIALSRPSANRQQA